MFVQPAERKETRKDEEHDWYNQREEQRRVKRSEESDWEGNWMKGLKWEPEHIEDHDSNWVPKSWDHLRKDLRRANFAKTKHESEMSLSERLESASTWHLPG